ncbi:MAG: lysophospholipid acyltransferase family protein [Anaerolineae bacterium]
MKPTKKLVRRVFNVLARTLTGLACEIHADDLARIPLKGPLILIVNHVNFLELPVIYPRIPSDLGTGFSKAENWDKPLYRLLFSNWDMIPINREAVDVTAMRRGLEALEKGRILFITPEGTRSHHGRLQEGKPGVVLIAERSGAPIWPIACYGGERFSENIKRFRRTDYHVVVGNPFHVRTHGVRVTGPVRQQIADEMMYQIAALLPPQYRGHYQDVGTATEVFLEFASPDDSNLRRVQQARRP